MVIGLGAFVFGGIVSFYVFSQWLIFVYPMAGLAVGGACLFATCLTLSNMLTQRAAIRRSVKRDLEDPIG